MSADPLDVYREFDPKLIESWKNLQELTFSEGALSAKFKLLIAMAIDVEIGTLQGATALGRRAIKFGATKKRLSKR